MAWETRKDGSITIFVGVNNDFTAVCVDTLAPLPSQTARLYVSMQTDCWVRLVGLYSLLTVYLPFYKTTVSGDNSLVLPDFTIFTRPSCQKVGKTLCDWSTHFFSLSPPDPTVQLFVHYFIVCFEIKCFWNTPTKQCMLLCVCYIFFNQGSRIRNFLEIQFLWWFQQCNSSS